MGDEDQGEDVGGRRDCPLDDHHQEILGKVNVVWEAEASSRMKEMVKQEIEKQRCSWVKGTQSRAYHSSIRLRLLWAKPTSSVSPSASMKNDICVR